MEIVQKIKGVEAPEFKVAEYELNISEDGTCRLFCNGAKVLYILQNNNKLQVYPSVQVQPLADILRLVAGLAFKGHDK